MSQSPAIDETRNRRRIMLSGYLGTTIEFYDFLLYAMMAAVVFPFVLFDAEDPFVATLMSFATLAVGYFARPIGGLLFGHFGDRFGRKRILITTMIIMGSMSMLIGLIPTWEAIGVAAAILLVVLRVIQGIALGGEWAGATLMSFESGGSGKRGFAASIVSSGGPSGAVLANLVLLLFALPEGGLVDGLGGWAWRIPFLLSALLVVLALALRVSISESPEYRKAEQLAAERPKFPLGEIIVHYPKQLVSAILGALGPLFLQGLLVTWMLAYAKSLTDDAGEPLYTQAETLWFSLIANFLNVFTIIAAAALSDRIGRKKVLVSGAVFTAVVLWPVFWLIGSGTAWGLFLGLLIGISLVIGLFYGPVAGWISEKFPTVARYTGVSLAYQTASTLGAGLAPLVASSLVAAAGGTDPTYVVLLGLALTVVSGLVFLFSRETAHSELVVARAVATPETAE